MNIKIKCQNGHGLGEITIDGEIRWWVGINFNPALEEIIIDSLCSDCLHREDEPPCGECEEKMTREEEIETLQGKNSSIELLLDEAQSELRETLVETETLRNAREELLNDIEDLESSLEMVHTYICSRWG